MDLAGLVGGRCGRVFDRDLTGTHVSGEGVLPCAYGVNRVEEAVFRASELFSRDVADGDRGSDGGVLRDGAEVCHELTRMQTDAGVCAGWSRKDEFAGSEMDAELGAPGELKNNVWAVVAGGWIDRQSRAIVMLTEVNRGRTQRTLRVSQFKDVEGLCG